MTTYTHDKHCVAAAVIAAVENLRDSEGMTVEEFAAAVTDGTPARWAESYLADGTKSCECVVDPVASADPAYWPCGYCGAARGEACQSLTGRATRPHDDRLRSVRRWRRYGGDGIDRLVTVLQRMATA